MIPCGHLYCWDCLDRLDECANCRGEILNHFNFYLVDEVDKKLKEIIRLVDKVGDDAKQIKD